MFVYHWGNDIVGCTDQNHQNLCFAYGTQIFAHCNVSYSVLSTHSLQILKEQIIFLFGLESQVFTSWKNTKFYTPAIIHIVAV